MNNIGNLISTTSSASEPAKLKASNTTLTNKDPIDAKTFCNFLDSYAKPTKSTSWPFRSNRDSKDLITMANKFTLPDPRAAEEPGTMPVVTMPDAQQLRIATAITAGKFGDPIPEVVAMKLKGILTFFTGPSAKTTIATAFEDGRFGAPEVVATKQGGTPASTDGSALPGASAGEGDGNPLYIDSSLPTEAPRLAEETSVSGGGGGENDSFKEEQLITINGLPQLFTDINLDSSLNDHEKYKKIFDATVPNLEGPLENKIRLVVVIKDFPEINQQYEDWVSRVKKDLVSELTSDLSKIYRSDMDSEDKTVAKDTHVATLRSKGYDTGVLVECLKQLPDELKKHLDETIQGLSTPDKPQGGASVSGGGGRGSSLSAEAPRGAEETASAPSDALDKEKIIMFLFDSKNSGRGIKNIELALHLMETYDQAFLSSLADKIESNLSKKSISFGWTMVNLLKGYKPGDNVSSAKKFVIPDHKANALYERSQLGTRTPLDKANTDLLLSAKAP